MSRPLKDSVIDHLKQHSLTEKQLQALEQLQASKPPKQPQSISRTAYAFAFAMILVLSVLIGHQSTNITQDIAKEVANNHLKMKPLDITSDNLDEVRTFFTLLDFLPAESSLYSQENTILGGRYCSIKGISAAQLRFENQQGKLETLYQVPYHPEDFQGLPRLEEGGAPIRVYERGLEVSIWVEKGLLMVSAKPPE